MRNGRSDPDTLGDPRLLTLLYLSLRIEGIILLLGAAAWFLVNLIVVVRFTASDEWVQSVWWVTTPVLWGLSFLYMLVKYGNAKKIDELISAQWIKKGRAGTPPKISGETPLLFLTILVNFFLFRAMSISILVLWVPMASTLLKASPTTHTFMVEALSESARRPNTIEFVGHHWMIGGLPDPPAEIWSKAEPGDIIVLSGVGNRLGLFYSEIELIKRQ